MARKRNRRIDDDDEDFVPNHDSEDDDCDDSLMHYLSPESEHEMNSHEPVKKRTKMSTTKYTTTTTTTKRAKSGATTDTNEKRYEWLQNTCDAFGVPHTSPDADPTTLTIPKLAYQNMKDFERQYWDIKKRYFDVVLFMKSGTFYEMYQPDALIGRDLLDFAVKEFAGMLRAGFYETAFMEKASVLLRHGYKVGRVEQTEKRRVGGGLANRELVQILTDATLMDNEMIGGYNSKILLAVKEDESREHVGVAFSDASTATIYLSYIRSEELEALLYQISPVTVLCQHNNLSTTVLKTLTQKVNTRIIHRRSQATWNSHQTREQIEEYLPTNGDTPQQLLDLLDNSLTMEALGILMGYLKYLLVDEAILSSGNIIPFENTTLMSISKRMVIDGQSLANLEVLRNRHNNQRGTLVEYLNRATTSQGKRLFERWLCAPLIIKADIESRLCAIEDLNNSGECDDIVQLLRKVPDLERMLSKVHYEATVKKDAIMYDPKTEERKVKLLLSALSGFKKLNSVVLKLQDLVESFQSPKMIQLVDDLSHLSQLLKEFDQAFDHDKANLEHKIYPNKGADEQYDKLVSSIDAIVAEFKDELNHFKRKCSSAKHVDSRKDIFLIEVPNLTSVPKDFTLVSETKKVKRYYSQLIKGKLPELKKLMSQRTERLECQTKLMLQKFDGYHHLWRRAVNLGAELDCLLSLCKISFQSHFTMTRPVFIESDTLTFNLRQMVHPCIYSTQVIPNDTILGDLHHANTVIVTGPNMGGKSTLLRQNCVAIIMAQIGCYVPATSFTLTPVDRIFTRIGANDRIMSGESTFMVEMNETSHILRHATRKSFVILDEMGRGTCTYDGISIAYSVVKYLAEKIQCRTLFSTHYSDLAEDLRFHPLIDVYQMGFHTETVATQQEGEEVTAQDSSSNIIFSYEFVPGVCSKSYGMNVGRAAGIDQKIIERAEHWATEYQKQLAEYQQNKRPSALLANQTRQFMNLLSTTTQLLQDHEMLTATQAARQQLTQLQQNTLNLHLSFQE